MKFQKEQLRDMIDDAQALIYDHKDEASVFGEDIKLDPFWTQYQILELQGLMHVYTARNSKDELVGYYATYVHRHMHYDVLIASNDVVYLKKGCRIHAIKFFQFVERQLREMGVKIMMFNIKSHVDYRPLAEKLGFEFMEYIYFKRFN